MVWLSIMCWMKNSINWNRIQTRWRCSLWGTIIPERCKYVCSEWDYPLPEGAGTQSGGASRPKFLWFPSLMQLPGMPLINFSWYPIFLEKNDVKNVMCVLAAARLDNGNALYVGLPLYLIWKLPPVQSSAARLVLEETERPYYARALKHSADCQFGSGQNSKCWLLP